MDCISHRRVMLCKFPAFDGAWQPDVMCEWFDAFMKMIDLQEAYDEPQRHH